MRGMSDVLSSHAAPPTTVSGPDGAESPVAAPGPGRLGLALVAAGVIALVGAGLLLWAAQGPAVFTEVVLAALAWCF